MLAQSCTQCGDSSSRPFIHCLGRELSSAQHTSSLNWAVHWAVPARWACGERCYFQSSSKIKAFPVGDVLPSTKLISLRAMFDGCTTYIIAQLSWCTGQCQPDEHDSLFERHLTWNQIFCRWWLTTTSQVYLSMRIRGFYSRRLRDLHITVYMESEVHTLHGNTTKQCFDHS